MSECLVLNKGFYAIQIADWQRVFSLVWQGHAQIVDQDYRTYDFHEWAELSKMIEDHPNGYVHTATLKLAIPDAIRLTRYEKLPDSDVKYSRNNLYEHYKFTCCYCGDKFKREELNLDHVVPRSLGGQKNWQNIVLSCIPCNSAKADKPLGEAVYPKGHKLAGQHMKLLVPVTRPKWQGIQYALVKMPVKIRDSWQAFLDSAYWDTPLDND